MKSSTKLLSILAASSLAASIPVVLAQGAPPAPPATPPAAPAATGGGRNGGGPVDAPTAAEYETLNKAVKALLAKDPDAAKVLAAHPAWAGPFAAFGGNNGGRGNMGTGGGRNGRAGGG